MFTKRVPRIRLTLLPVFSFGYNLLALPFSYSTCSTPRGMSERIYSVPTCAFGSSHSSRTMSLPAVTFTGYWSPRHILESLSRHDGAVVVIATSFVSHKYAVPWLSTYSLPRFATSSFTASSRVPCGHVWYFLSWSLFFFPSLFHTPGPFHCLTLLFHSRLPYM
jgi:hypothetical protein